MCVCFFFVVCLRKTRSTRTDKHVPYAPVFRAHFVLLIDPEARQELLVLSRPVSKSRVGPEAPCVCCGEWGGIMARGLRAECYGKWRKRGKLNRWPLTRKRAGVELVRGHAQKRAREYEELRTGPGALSRKRACIVLSVPERTAYRYEAWLRAQEIGRA